MLLVELHPLSSVIVNVLFPASTEKFPVPMYGAVPPVAETVTIPAPPLQVIGLDTPIETNKSAGMLIVTFAVVEQLLISVTITE